MKTLSFLGLALALVAASSPAWAALKRRPAKLPRTGFYINASGLILDNSALGIEQQVFQKKSFTLEGRYLRHYVDRARVQGMGGALGFHIWSRRGLKGWFFGPRIAILSLRIKDETKDGILLAEGQAVMPGVGAGLGYQWRWKSGMTFGLGASADYMLNTLTALPLKGQASARETSFTGLVPNALLNIGFSF